MSTEEITDKTIPHVLSLSQQKAMTHSEDAWNIQELSQMKLPSIESRHILSILQNCISQIEIAAILPGIHSESLSSVMDKDLSTEFGVHQMLGKRLETLQGLEQKSEGAQAEEVGESSVKLERAFKNSVRELLRLFQAHPDVIIDLRTRMEVGESEYTLIRGLKRFHKLMIEKLQTTPEEELQMVFCKQVPSAPSHDIGYNVKLEEEVAAAINQINAWIPEKHEEIKNLEKSLEERVKKEDDLLHCTDKECQSHMKISKTKQANIQEEIDQLDIQLNKLILENRGAERALQEKNESVEIEIEILLQQFDNEIEKYQADLELQEMDCEGVEGELAQMENAYAVLEVEYNQIQERCRLSEQKRKEQMRELELKTKAAIFAQAWWRGYCVRKALKNKGESKKAKKGKSKSKKK